MKTLVTGAAGFIGSALCLRLLENGQRVIGIDDHNDYYDPALKEARLSRHIDNPKYSHERFNIADFSALTDVFRKFKPDRVVNLAAQAGVRYSIENPQVYIQSNIVGFNNILQACCEYQVKHLVYASSSSVYGANEKLPLSVEQNVDHPLSLYAATKKSNELMAHSYSHIHKLPTTGLRFFTVYGPWGRPDMALFKFTSSILSGKEIQIYNHGNHTRDFTYIDDVIEGLLRVLNSPAIGNNHWEGIEPNPSYSKAPWKVYNIGNSNPVNLMDYLSALEGALGRKAKIKFLPAQPGDVSDTHADMKNFKDEFGYSPKVDIESGIGQFVKWYKNHWLNGKF